MYKIIEIENELEWLKYRGTGVGASEVATLFGFNPYKSKLEFHHEKVGFRPINFKPNLRMLYGHETEQLNSNLVEAWNGDKDSHATNIKKGLKFKYCKKLPEKAFIVNEKYPNLFVSPDREVFPTAVSDNTGALECKDTSSMVINAYYDKIVPSHVIQLHCQMMVWERSFGYLSYIIDAGRDYAEYYFDRNGIIFADTKNDRVITEEDLNTEVQSFWEGVVLARELSHKIMQSKLDFRMDKAMEYQQLLDQVEPEADQSLAYEVYMKENWYALARPKIERQGTEEDEKAAELFLKTKEVMKVATEQHQQQRNNILNLCKAGHKIILPGKGHIEVASTKNGTLIKVKN